MGLNPAGVTQLEKEEEVKDESLAEYGFVVEYWYSIARCRHGKLW